MAAHGRAKRDKAQPATHSRYWSAAITTHSDALDLEERVFTEKNPREIALSLKRSAEASKRRKGTAYQSAMSMLNFYVNRAGRNLSKTRKHVLQQSKAELRMVFGRGESPAPRSTLADG
jgi:hypothetical protein